MLLRLRSPVRRIYLFFVWSLLLPLPVALVSVLGAGAGAGGLTFFWISFVSRWDMVSGWIRKFGVLRVMLSEVFR